MHGHLNVKKKNDALGFLECDRSCLPEFSPHSNNRATLGFFLILQMTLLWAFPEQWICSRTYNINERVNSFGFEFMHLKKKKRNHSCKFSFLKWMFLFTLSHYYY